MYIYILLSVFIIHSNYLVQQDLWYQPLLTRYTYIWIYVYTQKIQQYPAIEKKTHPDSPILWDQFLNHRIIGGYHWWIKQLLAYNESYNHIIHQYTVHNITVKLFPPIHDGFNHESEISKKKTSGKST